MYEIIHEIPRLILSIQIRLFYFHHKSEKTDTNYFRLFSEKEKGNPSEFHALSFKENAQTHNFEL